MKSWKRCRTLCAAGALLVMLPLVGTGCGKSDKEGTGTAMSGNTSGGASDAAPGAPGNDMAGAPPGGAPGMSGNMPGGAPGMSGNMPGGAPGMPGGAPGMPGGDVAAGGAAAPAQPAKDAILFRQMRFSSRPVDVTRKQPNGQAIHYVQFRYHVKGDPEALLPFVAPPSSKSPDVGATWLVQIPKDCTKGKKSPGEWENLFCTYVVPDEAAIRQASHAIDSRLVSARHSMYRRAYVVDVLAGDSLPASAKAQAGDAIAGATPDSYQRTQQYAALAVEAAAKKHAGAKKLFSTATLAAVGDMAYENGHDADALWLYREGPRHVK